MGTKLWTALVDAKMIDPPAIAAVYRDMVDEWLRALLTEPRKNQEADPLTFDEAGQLRHPLFGAYVLVLPAHESGLQMVWQRSLEPRYAPRIDDRELARRLSMVAGRAFYLGYTSVVGAGDLTVYEQGMQVQAFSDKEASTQNLDRGLRRHFQLTFTQLEKWFGQWYHLHSFNDLYAPHKRTFWDDSAKEATGKTEAELVEAYRRGELTPGMPLYDYIRLSSESWAVYDSGTYRSRLYQVSTGDLVRKIPGVVLAEPREVSPEECFAEEAAYQTAYATRLEEVRTEKYGPQPESGTFAPDLRERPLAERLALAKERIQLARNWGRVYVTDIVGSLFTTADFTTIQKGDDAFVTEEHWGHRVGEYLGRVVSLRLNDDEGAVYVEATVHTRGSQSGAYRVHRAVAGSLRKAQPGEIEPDDVRRPADEEVANAR